MSAEKDFLIENGVLVKYNGTETDVVIPDGVTSIGDEAFFANTSLKSVTIPNSVTRIGDYAFSVCREMTNVTLCEGVTSIGRGAFFGCEKLVNISIPNSVTEIKPHAFEHCRSAKIDVEEGNVCYYIKGNCLIEKSTKTVLFGYGDSEIPADVKKIGACAFLGCSDLTELVIPPGVTTIEDRAFQECNNLHSVKLPASVTFIGFGAFRSCYSLKTFYFDGTEDEWENIDFPDTTMEENDKKYLIQENWVTDATVIIEKPTRKERKLQ